MTRKEQFGTWLKTQRQNAGLSQRALAELTNVHHTYISKIESATVDTMQSRDFLIELSFALQIGLEDVYDAAGYYDLDIIAQIVEIRPDRARELRRFYWPQPED